MRKLSRAKRKRQDIKRKSKAQKRRERKQRKMLEEQLFREKKQREKRNEIAAKLMLIVPTTIAAIGGLIIAILKKMNIIEGIVTIVTGAICGFLTVLIIVIAYAIISCIKEEKTKKGDS